MATTITFYGHHPGQPGYYFSNFSDHPTTIDGHLWATTEHYFQAMKFYGSDDTWYTTIKNAASPADAKKFGNSRQHPMRGDWEAVKDDIMRVALLAKAEQHQEIRDYLLATGNKTIVEAAPHDYYWGLGKDGSGKNMLGQIWMETREKLKNG